MTNKENISGFSEIDFGEKGTDWMDMVGRVLGKPVETLSPQNEPDTHQEIAIYEIENRIVTISRDIWGVDTHFRTHIRNLDDPWKNVYLEKVATIGVDSTNGSVSFSEPMEKNQIKAQGVKINSSGVVQTF